MNRAGCQASVTQELTFDAMEIQREDGRLKLEFPSINSSVEFGSHTFVPRWQFQFASSFGQASWWLSRSLSREIGVEIELKTLEGRN